MTTPRPQKARPWTKADHEENARRIQRRKDNEILERLARKLGVRGRDFAAAFARLIVDHLTAALRAPKPPHYNPSNHPADVDALRGALADLISDDVAEMFQILTGNEPYEPRDTEETPGSSEPESPSVQRDFYGPEDGEEAEA